MTAKKNGKFVGQITEILFEQRLYSEEEIRTALKSLPPPVKKRKKR